MKFEKGNTYGKGRTKGTPNVSTKHIRDAFTNILNDNLDALREDIKSMDSKQRPKVLMELSKFILPQLKATELSTREGNGVEPIIISFEDPKPTARNEESEI